MSEPQSPQVPPTGPRTGSARLLRLGSVVGVPIFVTPAWLLVTLFVTVSYAGFLREQVPGASAVLSYVLALVYAVALAASVLLHEFGHTIVSRVLGLQVRRIVIFLLGGISEIEGEPKRPRDEFVIAAAGPAVSFVLAGACFGLSLPARTSSAVWVLLILLAWSNVVLAVFNILPGLPLDGGRVVQSLIWAVSRNRLTGIKVASWSGRAVAALLALSILVGNAILGDSSRVDLGEITATALGFAVAAFLWFGAGQTLRAAELGARAELLQLGRLVRHSVYLPPTTPLSEALRQATEQHAAGIVVIDAEGRSRAIVGEADVMRLETRRHPWTTLAQLARDLEPGLILAENLSGMAVLDAVRTSPASEYLVVGADGVTRGVVATVDVARALGLRYPGP